MADTAKLRRAYLDAAVSYAASVCESNGTAICARDVLWRYVSNAWPPVTDAELGDVMSNNAAWQKLAT